MPPVAIYDALERLGLFDGVLGIDPTDDGFVIRLAEGAPLGRGVAKWTAEADDFATAAGACGFSVVMVPAVHLVRPEV